MTIPPDVIAVIASIAILGITIYISARLELRRMRRGAFKT